MLRLRPVPESREEILWKLLADNPRRLCSLEEGGDGGDGEGGNGHDRTVGGGRH